MPHTENFSKYQMFILEKLKELEEKISETRNDFKTLSIEHKELLLKILDYEKGREREEAKKNGFYAAYATIFGFMGSIIIPLIQYLVEKHIR